MIYNRFILLCMSLLPLPLYSLRVIPGTLDPNFGADGTGLAFIDLGGSDRIRSLARDPQGRIVAGGEGGAGTDVLIARFTPSGELDTSFGRNGTGFNLIDLGGVDNILTIALDSQARIIAGGRGGAGSDAVIMRFEPDGTLDATFGGNGTGFRLIDFGGADRINALVLDSQDRIIAVGRGGTNGAIMRFSQDGAFDTTFGGSGTGFNLIDLGGTDSFNSVVIDVQGRSIVGGSGTSDNLGVVARITQTGELDFSFGPNGTGFTPINTTGSFEIVSSVILDKQGRIVTVGSAIIMGSSQGVLAALTSEGELDSTFGSEGTGLVVVDLGGSDSFNSVALDAQGRIIVVGQGGLGTDALIMRFTPDGTLDLDFGGNGTGFNLIGLGGADTILSLFLTAQGGIVAGGQARATTDVLLLGVTNQLLSDLVIALREKYCFTAS